VKYATKEKNPVVFIPVRIAYYYRLLDEIDFKLLVELYRHNSLTRNPGNTFLVSIETVAKTIGCTTTETEKSLEYLERLELIKWFARFHEFPDIVRVKLGRMKARRGNIPDVSKRDKDGQD